MRAPKDWWGKQKNQEVWDKDRDPISVAQEKKRSLVSPSRD
jgi:hypothetical protein